MKNKISPQKYAKERIADLPYFECVVSANDNDPNSNGLVTVVLSKRQPSDKIAVAFFLLDKFCLGLKKTGFRINMDQHDYIEYVKQIAIGVRQNLMKSELSYAHDLVFGAIDYAEELGFQPDKEFAYTKYFLDEDLITERIDEIEFGKNGRPVYIPGVADSPAKVIATLKKTVGEGNFDFVDRSKQQ